MDSENRDNIHAMPTRKPPKTYFFVAIAAARAAIAWTAAEAWAAAKRCRAQRTGTHHIAPLGAERSNHD